MTLKNLNISTDIQDSIELLLSPLQESGLKIIILIKFVRLLRITRMNFLCFIMKKQD